tara:strand:+ start:628 stop:1188 length:561 start_codon:yes stop_codon:yes gene_type:complete
MHKLLIYLTILMLSLTKVNAASLDKTMNWESTLQEVMKEQTFKRLGKATFSVLFWDLYKSELLTSSGTYPMQSKNEKLIYKIQYLKAVSAKDLVEYTVEQWQHLEIKPHKYQAFIPKISDIWPDLKVGDSLALVMSHQKSAFYFNDNLVGSIEDPMFGPLFIDIWLSEKTSEPKLRQQLLGSLIND